MRRITYASSAAKLVLISVILVLVLCTGLFAQTTITGVVTRGGIPCPNARVVLSDNFGATTLTARTDANGNYSFPDVIIFFGTEFTITFNAINAVPVINQAVDTSLESPIIVDVDLTYGKTPLLDDFSGTAVDMYDELTNPTGKWEFFNSTGETDGIVVNATDGILNIEPVTGRAGIISRSTFPKYASYEFVLPKRYVGTNQCFTIIKDKVSNYANFIDIQDEAASSTSPYLQCFDASGTKFLAATGLPAYPTRIIVLRTGNYYDVFANGSWYGMGSTDTIPDEAFIYMYGYEAEGGTTTAYFDDIRAGTTVPVTFSSIANARTAANNTLLSINNAIVTASYNDCFYVEAADRSAGIKVESTAKPAKGSNALISGKIVRQNREVVLQATEVITGGSSTVPFAVAVTGKTAAELDKDGASAQGLIVKVAGTVSEPPTNDGTKVTGFYLDDGSGIIAGTHKGIYVKLDPSMNLPLGIINSGDFITREGPLSVYMADGTTPVPSITTSKGMDFIPTFTAYNDLANIPSYASSPNCTFYSFKDESYTENIVPGGLLKDITTGNYVAERVTITGSGMTELQYAGDHPAAGSDAEKYFADLTNPLNRVWYANLIGVPWGTSYASWYEDITFEGLDPNALYEFVGSVNRGESTTATTRFTISGQVDRTYACSVGATKESDDACTFITGNNSVGNVARWINIKPSPDGSFRVRSSWVSGGYGKGYAIAVFRLRKQAEIEQL